MLYIFHVSISWIHFYFIGIYSLLCLVSDFILYRRPRHYLLSSCSSIMWHCHRKWSPDTPLLEYRLSLVIWTQYNVGRMVLYGFHNRVRKGHTAFTWISWNACSLDIPSQIAPSHNLPAVLWEAKANGETMCKVFCFTVLAQPIFQPFQPKCQIHEWRQKSFGSKSSTLVLAAVEINRSSESWQMKYCTLWSREESIPL